MVDIEKLKESLYIINSISYEMMQLKNELDILQIPVESVVLRELRKWEDMQICKLLDEFMVFKKIDLETYNIFVPIIDYINKYNGIRTSRNKQLAHSNREANKKWKPWWIALHGQAVPNSQYERVAIYELLQKVWKILEFKYNKELTDAHSEFRADHTKFINELNNRVPPMNFLENVIPTLTEVQNRLIEKQIKINIMPATNSR